MQNGLLIFKLRRNIALEGDVQLAERELAALVGNAAPCDIAEVKGHFPEISGYARKNGIRAYRAEASLDVLPLLTKRITFVQRIYCITEDTPTARSLIESLHPVATYRADEGQLYAEVVPHYALFELADVVARTAKSVSEVKKQLPLMLDGLMGRTDDTYAYKLKDKALSAQITSSHLSHDIHYYKAKFFPRMARAMLNIAASKVPTESPLVLDPFVGSGTTLLESALLGMPATGIDLDPLSVLISQTKCSALSLDSTDVERAITKCEHRLHSTHKEVMETLQFPHWFMKNRKMNEAVAAELSQTIHRLRSVVEASDPVVRDLLRVLMSDAIARHVKMRFMGTGSGRFALTFSKTSPQEIFIRSIKRYARVVALWEWLRDTLNLSLAPVTACRGDARKLEEIDHIDIVVTSPPYLPASSGRESYAKARMPSLIALDMGAALDVDTLVDESVGSMDSAENQQNSLSDRVAHLVTWLENDPLRAVKAEPTARYFLDMRRTFAALRDKLNPGGVAVVVSGRQSTFYQHSTRQVLYSVPAAEMLADEAQHSGLEVLELLHIQLQKSNMNARPRSLDDYDETLIFLRRP